MQSVPISILDYIAVGIAAGVLVPMGPVFAGAFAGATGWFADSLTNPLVVPVHEDGKMISNVKADAKYALSWVVRLHMLFVETLVTALMAGAGNYFLPGTTGTVLGAILGFWIGSLPF